MFFLLLACTGYAPPKETGETGFVDTAAETAETGESADTGGDTGPDTSADTGETGHTEESSAPVDNDGDGATTESDCDDADPAVYPGAAERCNGTDDDCDGLTDDEDDDVTGQNRYFPDEDGDGWGGDGDPTLSCSATLKGYARNAADCDDLAPEVNPDATEVCNNADDNCDGSVDEGFPTTDWYRDEDGDGFGRTSDMVTSCEPPRDYSSEGGDCDDRDAAVHPDAAEVCDEADNNCDGTSDEGIVVPTWYRDADGDGYGARSSSRDACEAPKGHVSNGDDCDDSDPARFPGVEDVCNDLDDDCDGEVDEDASTPYYTDSDGDGYGTEDSVRYACEAPFGTAAVAGDCDDTTDLVVPGALEVCNGIDDNCDGVVDDSC